jgi:hypothetical protein
MYAVSFLLPIAAETVKEPLDRLRNGQESIGIDGKHSRHRLNGPINARIERSTNH